MPAVPKVTGANRCARFEEGGKCRRSRAPTGRARLRRTPAVDEQARATAACARAVDGAFRIDFGYWLIALITPNMRSKPGGLSDDAQAVSKQLAGLVSALGHARRSVGSVLVQNPL